MLPAPDEAGFLRAPVGRWIVVGTSLVWCHSPTLCGSIGWGEPTEEDTRRLVRLLDAYRQLAPRFDVLLDGSAIERVGGPSLMLLLEWTREHFAELTRRIRQRVGVISDGMAAVTMAGIQPVLGGPGDVTLVRQAREGFRLLLPDGGDGLCDELTRLVVEARGLTPVVIALRPLLKHHGGRLSLREAAKALRLSVRTLQRQLREAGRSYRDEQIEARFQLALELLGGDEKIVAVAGRVGLSEAGLLRLVRARTGLTPTELRRKLTAATE